jgi:protein-tyrosine phosphatase
MKVLMVCTGNICRSPLMERVAATHAEKAGLHVTFTSGGTSAEETGNPIDHRARRVLEHAGYDGSNHRAHQVSAREVAEADLVIVAEEHHRQRLLRLAPHADVRLLSAFDPDLADGTGLPDPWYGPPEDFDETIMAVEAAMPGLIAYLRTRPEAAPAIFRE